MLNLPDSFIRTIQLTGESSGQQGSGPKTCKNGFSAHTKESFLGIGREQVEHVAKLARLALTEEELNPAAKEQLLQLGREPQLVRPFRVPWYPVVPFVFTALAVARIFPSARKERP